MLSFPEVHPGIHMALCPICRFKRERDGRESGEARGPTERNRVDSSRAAGSEYSAAANPVPSQAEAEDGQ